MRNRGDVYRRGEGGRKLGGGRKFVRKFATYIHTYLLTPWSRVPLQKQIGSQSRNSPHFMEPEGSLPHSQVPATCHYTKIC